jgi:hypothetical protein
MWPSFPLPGWQGYSTAFGQGAANAGWHLASRGYWDLCAHVVIYADFFEPQSCWCVAGNSRRDRLYLQTAFVTTAIHGLRAMPWMEASGTIRD